MFRGALESINVPACENLHYQEERDVLTDVRNISYLVNEPKIFGFSPNIFGDFVA